MTRLDIRYAYQNAPGSQNDSTNLITFRMDKPFDLSPQWKIGTRVDLPLMITNRISNDNPEGHNRFGFSDALVQAILIHTPSPDFAWAVGAQIVFPTASQDEMGTGRWRVVPTVGIRWTTNHILKGSWIAFAARWDKDFAEARSHSTRTNDFQFAPVINIPLRNQWFINLFPSTDIRYNAGKMIKKNVVTSLEVGVPIIKDYRVYDHSTRLKFMCFDTTY